MEEIKKEKQTNYKQLQSRVSKKLTPLFSGAKAKNTFNQIKGGKTSYLKFKRVENTAYDPIWIEQIEDSLFDLGEIIKAPKLNTQIVKDVVPVELARKINSDSITHLATHTQYIKEINENGDVVPNKILNIGADDFYQTYENRFIATLIRKLVLFVEKRWEFIEANTEVKESQILMYKTKTIVDGREVEIETKVKVSSNTEYESEQISKSRDYAKRVEDLRRYILYYYNSDFMKKFKTEKNVKNPIIMTNIIRKNPLYNKAYRLYKFIEKYESFGVSVHITNDYYELTEKEMEDVNNSLAADFLTLKPSETRKTRKKVEKTYKPNVITTIDDDEFTYGDWYKGPFEIVRVDLGYFEHLEKKKNEVPAHPTKKEQEYYKDEIAENKEIKEEQKHITQVISEKKKQGKIIEKKFGKIITQRNIEEAEEAKRIEKEKNERELSDIEKARLLLMGDAEDVAVEPVAEATPVEETKQEEPKVKKTAPKVKKSRVKKEKKSEIKEEAFEPQVEEAKPVPVLEETPEDIEIVEPLPESEPEIVPEPVVESKAKSETKIEEKPLIKEVSDIPTPKKKPSKPKEKPVEVIKPKPEPKVKETKRAKIPGKFIAKLPEGYYVSPNKYSIDKSDAKIFDDFNEANDLKKTFGGKVIKL